MRLTWFGHMKRRDQEYFGRKTLEMVSPGRRKRGRPKQRCMDGLCQPIHDSHRNNKRGHEVLDKQSVSFCRVLRSGLELNRIVILKSLTAVP